MPNLHAFLLQTIALEHGLTYRALRVKNALHFEPTVRLTFRTLALLLDVSVPTEEGR